MTLIPKHEPFYRGDIVALFPGGFGWILSGRTRVFFAAAAVSDARYRFDELAISMRVRFRIRTHDGRREARSISVVE